MDKLYKVSSVKIISLTRLDKLYVTYGRHYYFLKKKKKLNTSSWSRTHVDNKNNNKSLIAFFYKSIILLQCYISIMHLKTLKVSFIFFKILTSE